MKTLTIHQPWATLCVTRQPQRCGHDVCLDVGPTCRIRPHRAVKWIETRSWPAPASLIGQRIAIHAGAKRPTLDEMHGPYQITRESPAWMRGPTEEGPHACIRLPLGAVVGSAVLTACVPMVGNGVDFGDPDALNVPWGHSGHDGRVPGMALELCQRADDHHYRVTDVSDQEPLGDFAPGRWAWLLADAAPTTERCPECWGVGGFDFRTYERPDDLEMCPVCSGAGRCDPIPAKGRQRVWEWTP